MVRMSGGWVYFNVADLPSRCTDPELVVVQFRVPRRSRDLFERRHEVLPARFGVQRCTVVVPGVVLAGESNPAFARIDRLLDVGQQLS